MDNVIWWERALDAANRINAHQVGKEYWVYKAVETGKWFVLDGADLVGLAMCWYDDRVNGYSNWCNMGYGTGFRNSLCIFAPCPECGNEAVTANHRGGAEFACHACNLLWTHTQLAVEYQMSRRRANRQAPSAEAGGE